MKWPLEILRRDRHGPRSEWEGHNMTVANHLASTGSTPVRNSLTMTILVWWAALVTVCLFPLVCVANSPKPADRPPSAGFSLLPGGCALHRPTPNPPGPKPDLPSIERPEPLGPGAPKNDSQSQASPSLFSGFSTEQALLGVGCIVGSVELLAFAGLIVSRRRRRDEMATEDSRARPVEIKAPKDAPKDGTQ